MTDKIGHVSELWRYPVSSLGGERLDTALIGETGVEGDRLYGVAAVSDEVAAEPVRPGWGAIANVRARMGDSGLEIAAPGGEWISAPGAEADVSLSGFFGFEAVLRPLSDGPVPVAGPALAPRYRRAPVHLLTTASLARLKALHPAGEPNPRRFRPNILIDMPEVEGHFPETEWIGRRIAVGDLEMTVVEPCSRCGFIMLAQDELGHDPEILRSLVRNNGKNIGVYCSVDRPGEVSTGAPLRFVD